MPRPTDPRLRAVSDQLIGRRPIPRLLAALCADRPDSDLLLAALGLTPRPSKTPVAPVRMPGRRGPTGRKST